MAESDMVPCPLCKGKGKTGPAMDMLARPPKEQREYEQMVRDLGEMFTCPLCSGTGVRATSPERATKSEER